MPGRCAARGADIGLLGPNDIRSLAAELDLRPRKSLGQNFVHDANTVRRIVAGAGVTTADQVLEVGPGLGSLTLALLEHGPAVIAVEKDPVLANRLPQTVAEHAPGDAPRLTVMSRDVLRLRREELTTEPTAVVANLPYNVAVPALLHLLAEFDSIRTVMVMVQLEVAERLAAEPGGKDYGVPSAKARFFGEVRRCGTVPPSVFWPVPRVNSGLVRIDRYDTAPWPGDDAFRRGLFALIDTAFAQRRKTSRNAFADWAGSGAQAAERLAAAGIDPTRRGETLSIVDFVRLLQVSGGSARLDGGEAKLGPSHQSGGSARLDGGEAKLGPSHQSGGSARLDGGEAKLGPPHQTVSTRDNCSTNSVQES